MPEFDKVNKMGSESSERRQLLNVYIGTMDWKLSPGAKFMFPGFLKEKQQHTP